MARINKNGTFSGIMGDMVLRSYNGKTFAYKRPDHVNNPQSRSQMTQRVKKQNIVNIYGSMKPALKDNFQEKTGHQSDYSIFVSCNLSQQAVYLTDWEAGVRRVSVVAPYIVSFGKIPPIDYTLEDEWLVSDIQVGNLQLTDNTMVFNLTAAILTNNENWKAGDTLEFICCHQNIRNFTTNNETAPYTECDYANIELSKVERGLLKKFLDKIEVKVNENGFLCMRATGEGGFAMVHKRPTVKGVAVSIQSMKVNNQLLSVYSSEGQCNKAIACYMKKKKINRF